jgi:hypothetical protein
LAGNQYLRSVCMGSSLVGWQCGLPAGAGETWSVILSALKIGEISGLCHRIREAMTLKKGGPIAGSLQKLFAHLLAHCFLAGELPRTERKVRTSVCASDMTYSITKGVS